MEYQSIQRLLNWKHENQSPSALNLLETEYILVLSIDRKYCVRFFQHSFEWWFSRLMCQRMLSHQLLWVSYCSWIFINNFNWWWNNNWYDSLILEERVASNDPDRLSDIKARSPLILIYDLERMKIHDLVLRCDRNKFVVLVNNNQWRAVEWWIRSSQSFDWFRKEEHQLAQVNEELLDLCDLWELTIRDDWRLLWTWNEK